MGKLQMPGDAPSQDIFAGKRFYQPGVLAAYCILTNLPFGIFLLGMNVYRRGNIWAGRITMLLCAFTMVVQSFALAFGTMVVDMRMLLLNIVVGLGVMKSEKARYDKAVLKGALPSKWWPPLLFVVANMLAIYFLAQYAER